MFFWSNGFAQNIEFELQSDGQLPFENNFKWTIKCPVTRANMNEPMHAMEEFSRELRIHCYVKDVTEQAQC